MADQIRQTTIDLARHLTRDARSYAFYQAVSLIQGQLDEGREPGIHLLPSSERVLFRVEHRLQFPTSDLSSIRVLNDTSEGTKSPWSLRSEDASNIPSEGYPLFELKVNFLGMHGVTSPLPAHYQEILAGCDEDDSLLLDFFDFFHNRLIGFLYRAMRKYRYDLVYKPRATDAFSKRMFSVFGMANDELRERSKIRWSRLLCFAGLLSTRNRSAIVVAAVIQRAFFFRPEDRDVSVEVKEWIPRYVDIPRDQRSYLGASNSQLGLNMIVGDRVDDIGSKFQVLIRNLNFKRFRDFLPLGSDYSPLRNLIELILRDQFAYDLKLGLSHREAKPVMIGDESDTGWIGWTTFLGNSETITSQKNDVVINARL